MTAPVFIAGEGSLAAARPGSVVRLDGAEGRHAADVRRLRPGEPIELVDGGGLRAAGSVAAVSPAALDVLVSRVEREREPAVRLIVVLALIKGDRFDAALRMLTEAGVDEIVPWAARRSIVQWRDDKAGRALQRANALVAEAGKQARRARFPVVRPVVGGPQVAEQIAGCGAGLVLHETALLPLPAAALPPAGEIVLVIGPEGGIADEELAAFTAAGALTVRMGPTVLRSATAAVAAAAVVMAASGRWEPPDAGAVSTGDDAAAVPDVESFG